MYFLNQSPIVASHEIVCRLTSEPALTRIGGRAGGVPVLVHPIGAFCEARYAPLYHDPRARAAYDAAAVEQVASYFPDVILLDGYRYLVTAPWLEAYPSRVLNLHFADLTARRPDGGPRFPGRRAVREAIVAGCDETRATVHLVNERPDDGAPIIRSWPFPVSPLVEDLRTRDAKDVLKAYVYVHQQWMMRTAAGPLASAALRLVSAGTVALDALAAAGALAPAPWTLDRDGSLIAPDVALAGAAS